MYTYGEKQLLRIKDTGVSYFHEKAQANSHIRFRCCEKQFSNTR